MCVVIFPGNIEVISSFNEQMIQINNYLLWVVLFLMNK